MEQVDKVRRLFLREARSLEERALKLEDDSLEQAELLDSTVSLRILAELCRYQGSLH